MPTQYISFVVRIALTDEGLMVRGRLFRVPEKEGQDFQTWADLIVLLEKHLAAPGSSQETPSPGERSE